MTIPSDSGVFSDIASDEATSISLHFFRLINGFLENLTRRFYGKLGVFGILDRLAAQNQRIESLKRNVFVSDRFHHGLRPP